MITNLNEYLQNIANVIKIKKNMPAGRKISADKFADEINTIENVPIFKNVEELNNNLMYPENTFAIVSDGVYYVGTYKMDRGSWTHMGDETLGVTYMEKLNKVTGGVPDEYEGMGATDEEIHIALDDILRDGKQDRQTLRNLTDVLGQQPTTCEGVGGRESQVHSIFDEILGVKI